MLYRIIDIIEKREEMEEEEKDMTRGKEEEKYGIYIPAVILNI